MSEDDGYVHDPAAFDGEARSESDGRADEAGEPGDQGEEAANAAAGDVPRGEERTFGWRGWVLVGWVVVAFVLVPAYLFVVPRAGDTLALFGLGYRDTFLVVPLIPALVLGVLAVWATTRP